MNKKEKSVGVITEQGDLGLGFAPISKNDKEKIDKADAAKKTK